MLMLSVTIKSITLSVIMLNVIMLNVIMPNAIMPSVAMLNLIVTFCCTFRSETIFIMLIVIMLNVVMLSVVAPTEQKTMIIFFHFLQKFAKKNLSGADLDIFLIENYLWIC
jgi:hypothetical protein